ncbi:biliverdin-producing heme oxygenase [Caulobacter hibisci]|uniref:Biliverdin-producing heme oxygenase n=1 Tax=Caulobacter hibisci TaxID=2035993 RepID=A0ABS0T1Z2_9CAUL|nr:biliverdin-producing heme oxygenase [Caulobacter hibisci]MBI1684928.1 biliverdin-producing heme oxygenase [Caulobacter hibisci]
MRNATRGEHARLDALIRGAGFLTNRSRYLAYLSATLNAREAIERALGTANAVGVYAAWPQRRIASYLRQDLRDLGHAAPLPSEPSDFTVSGRAGILGALYVLEGASLGARLLQKAVLDLGMDAAFGARHMAMQTADSSAWLRFTSLLDEADFDAPDEAECAQTASRTFERFEQAYQEALIRRQPVTQSS